MTLKGHLANQFITYLQAISCSVQNLHYVLPSLKIIFIFQRKSGKFFPGIQGPKWIPDVISQIKGCLKFLRYCPIIKTLGKLKFFFQSVGHYHQLIFTDIGGLERAVHVKSIKNPRPRFFFFHSTWSRFLWVLVQWKYWTTRAGKTLFILLNIVLKKRFIYFFKSKNSVFWLLDRILIVVLWKTIIIVSFRRFSWTKENWKA